MARDVWPGCVHRGCGQGRVWTGEGVDRGCGLGRVWTGASGHRGCGWGCVDRSVWPSALGGPSDLQLLSELTVYTHHISKASIDFVLFTVNLFCVCERFISRIAFV